jgi:hypothetical protein
VHIHLRLFSSESTFFASEISRCGGSSASGIYIARTDLRRRYLRRYALWLYGSTDYAIFDPSLTAPELLLELSGLHIAAGTLQDASFENDVMDAMILHLVRRSDEMLPECFLGKLLQSNVKASTGRKLMADWAAWSMGVSEDELKKLLEQAQDADFGFERG